MGSEVEVTGTAWEDPLAFDHGTRKQFVEVRWWGGTRLVFNCLTQNYCLQCVPCAYVSECWLYGKQLNTRIYLEDSCCWLLESTHNSIPKAGEGNGICFSPVFYLVFSTFLSRMSTVEMLRFIHYVVLLSQCTHYMIIVGCSSANLGYFIFINKCAINLLSHGACPLPSSWHSLLSCSSHACACLAHFAHTPCRQAVSVIEGVIALTDLGHCLVQRAGWLSSVGKRLALLWHRWTDAAHT